MRSGNPALSDKIFTEAIKATPVSAAQAGSMTISGTVNKTALALLLCIAAASWTWNLIFSSPSPQAATGLMIFGLFGGFIVAMVTIFKMSWAPITTPIYALLEGLFLGGISGIFEKQYPGIVIQAISLTFGTLAALLLAYQSRLIKVTDNFRLGIVAATGGICLVYVIDIILGFFNIRIPMIHQGGWLGIGFSLFVVVIASLNLVLDFDFIERGAEAGAPKFMEWYGAFGLMVTLVWLYLEILRLLSKLNRK
ncbi:MAG: Bax inhibitor-1/YccA family protein [Candidatus Omnitrophica bacterium]|nr:Bax inhibitor-1/YccA family protein [Candidatus Omnitrophota bacterium]